MVPMNEFEESKWINKQAALEFIESADMYILERQKLFAVMKSLYKHFLEDNNKTIKILELGCGDGRVTHELLQIDANLEGTLIDGSAEMVESAKNRLKSYPGLKFIQNTFQELVNSNLLSETFDFVVSSLAIHHLQEDEKKTLFEYVYNHLSPSGFFLNMDVIRAPTESLENWYLKLWKEWIIENEAKMEHSESFQNIPDQYKNNPDNNPDTLENQLKLLKSAGFSNVDCYYKYGIFSVYGGQK